MLYVVYAVLDTIRTILLAALAIGFVWLFIKVMVDGIHDGMLPWMILGLVCGVLCEVVSCGWKKLKAKVGRV